MSPLPIAVEVCSGPNDGETYRSDTGTFTVGSRGAANLPLAGEPDLPPLTSVSVELVGEAVTITADAEFTYAKNTAKMAENVTLPAMITLGKVDLCVSAVEGAASAPAGATPPAGTAPPGGEAAPPPPPPPPDAPQPPPAAPASGDEAAPAEATGPLCPDCGLVNKPGAARCERCRRWLD